MVARSSSGPKQLATAGGQEQPPPGAAPAAPRTETINAGAIANKRPEVAAAIRRLRNL
jgi:hypothetical protein